MSAESVAPEKRVPVLYLDLDGTVREGKDDALGRFVNGPEDVRVFPAAVEGMRRWKAAGGRVAGVSNQGGIALGIVSLEKVAAAVMETQRQCQGLFDRILFCQHHPKADNPEMARCWCRKPSAGAVAEAAYGLAERFPGEIYPPYMGLFVGDRPEDEECAKSAGLDFMWAAEWRAQFDGQADGKPMGEPAIDAPRAVDQLAWWVQHGEELRLENERLRGEVGSLQAELNRLHGQFRYALSRCITLIDGQADG